jgi:hypothetical protein
VSSIPLHGPPYNDEVIAQIQSHPDRTPFYPRVAAMFRDAQEQLRENSRKTLEIRRFFSCLLRQAWNN